MKVPAGVTVYAGRGRWKSGKDTPRQYDDLLIPVVTKKKKEEKKEKPSGESSGAGGK